MFAIQRLEAIRLNYHEVCWDILLPPNSIFKSFYTIYINNNPYTTSFVGDTLLIKIIYNPIGGGGMNWDRMKHVRSLLEDKGVTFEYYETTFEMRGDAMARLVAKDGDIIGIAGGDGTIHEVISATYDMDLTYVLLPFGSGNDTARSAGVFNYTDEDIVNAFTNGTERPIPYWVANDMVFVQTLSFGTIVDINMIADEYIENLMSKMTGNTTTAIIRRYIDVTKTLMSSMIHSILNGELSFVKVAKSKDYRRIALKAVAKCKAKKYTITYDGVTRDVESILLSVQNVEYMGGGLNLCPNAAIDSADLIVLNVNKKSKYRYVMNLVAMSSGKIETQKNVEYFKAKSVTVKSDEITHMIVDGETLKFDGSIEVKPGDHKLIVRV